LSMDWAMSVIVFLLTIDTPDCGVPKGEGEA
jgi:hypothetical protein